MIIQSGLITDTLVRDFTNPAANDSFSNHAVDSIHCVLCREHSNVARSNESH